MTQQNYLILLHNKKINLIINLKIRYFFKLMLDNFNVNLQITKKPNDNIEINGYTKSDLLIARQIGKINV